ncbi:uncharacterized protein CLUP02_17625 [Colletotrichum lupini]|uniref:Uncharacterized protein n=1 Tax=Colletotrichum lupini TaxID=145971 RepID=A0A9Q8SEW5_9PEZI|nr:uncharacterized protein CLUP02_17625 [Colletotrichum lupini]UQC76114.1 hypothetical protein CLUP02_17625 [Colletotrichum lupini]
MDGGWLCFNASIHVPGGVFIRVSTATCCSFISISNISKPAFLTSNFGSHQSNTLVRRWDWSRKGQRLDKALSRRTKRIHSNFLPSNLNNFQTFASQTPLLSNSTSISHVGRKQESSTNGSEVLDFGARFVFAERNITCYFSSQHLLISSWLPRNHLGSLSLGPTNSTMWERGFSTASLLKRVFASGWATDKPNVLEPRSNMQGEFPRRMIKHAIVSELSDTIEYNETKSTYQSTAILVAAKPDIQNDLDPLS